MDEALTFKTREVFRAWLLVNNQVSQGIWLLLGKPGGPQTLTANEALEEALCFGWIDGQMRRLDEKSYKKYFTRRRSDSKWSEKNKALAEKLERMGAMTDHGRVKIEEARRNGQWDTPAPPPITDAQVESLAALLAGNGLAHANFLHMPNSVKRTYARAYLDAKTEAGRAARLVWMTERLEKNMRPM